MPWPFMQRRVTPPKAQQATAFAGGNIATMSWQGRYHNFHRMMPYVRKCLISLA
jgi:hypothetical protein